ncbi:copper resistance CopC/CopD family protein [Actinotalea solisilvae]|uniref:copper resistance CopC/CopD family protein n=1 Tax=Actinotalea solisilvae TaxID=2072922 RepID=UPI0018F1106D|nr:FixH family protein [Actinotalea solisilvae]
MRSVAARRLGGAVVVAAALALVVVGAGPAGAHATLLGTDPAPGAVLEAAPERVTFTFDEDVVAVPAGVQVLDARGEVVASAASVAGARLDVDLTGPVGDGTLVVVWRVVSADGHPLGGSLTFSVGAPSTTAPDVAADPGGPTRAPPVLAAARAGGYVGLLLAVGLVAFAILALAATPDAGRARRRVVVSARGAAALAAAGWLVALPLTASYQLGRPSSVTAPVWAALAAAQYGVAAAVVLGVAASVALLGGGAPAGPRAAAALVAATVAAGAPALTGHTRAASPEALVVGVDVLHLLAAAVWLGGLVGLVLALTALPARGSAVVAVLARFSASAAGLLALLVASGGLLAWRVAGSWAALVGTGYGRLLLLKVGIAAVAVGVAAWNRFVLLPRVQAPVRGADPRAGRRLVARSVGAEAALLVGVVLVTGVLVDTSPEEPAGSVAVAPVAARSTELGDVVVAADVTPGVPGPTTVTIRLEHPDGGPAEGVQSLSARLSSDTVDLGDVPLTFVGPGTYAAPVVLPAPGTWRLQVSVRRGEFDNPVTTLELVVG